MRQATFRAVVLVAVSALLLLGVASASAATPPPSVSAPNALVVEASTGDVAYAKAPNRRREIASATKLMTALLTLERTKPSTVYRAVRYRALPAESKINLRPGEKMTVADLMRGLLIESANDAAATLAERVAGSRPAFVKAMNVRAQQLGLKDTHYANPIGLDAPDNYSSARDLVRLTLRLRAFDFFRRTVAREQVTLRSGDRPRTLENRNGLVRLPQVNGVKTGHTQQAGYVLVGSGRQRGITLISVVLGAPSVAARESDTRRLLAWAFNRYQRVRAVPPDEVLARVPIRYRRGAELDLIAGDSSRRFVVLKGQSLRRCGLDAPTEVEGPIRRGKALGKVKVCRGEKKIATLPLVASADVPKAGAAVRTKDWFTRPLTLILVVLLGLGGSVLLARARRRGPNRRRRSPADREPEAA
jgi:serine-type D-Ala-D-Ala carboxypeptidase (penicillin-binding protein 5/6)